MNTHTIFTNNTNQPQSLAFLEIHPSFFTPPFDYPYSLSRLLFFFLLFFFPLHLRYILLVAPDFLSYLRAFFPQ